jgi:hypothetical protein
MTAASRRWHAAAGAALAVAFASVGLLFLALPGGVLAFFDGWSRRSGLAAFPGPVDRFWLVLAAAYMYVVTVLAWSMFRRPEDPVYPRLLAHAKLCSAALSLAAFALSAPHLIFLTNGIVDGAIGGAALVLWRRCRRDAAASA